VYYLILFFPLSGRPPFEKGGQNFAVARRFFFEMSRRSDAHRLHSKNIDFMLSNAILFMLFYSTFDGRARY
jgi:hypothetical protein